MSIDHDHDIASRLQLESEWLERHAPAVPPEQESSWLSQRLPHAESIERQLQALDQQFSASVS